MTQYDGTLITFEGDDGTGKSTQLSSLEEYLSPKVSKVIKTREPGGTDVAEAIRRVILSPDYHKNPIVDLFLFSAARAHHTNELIIPALKAGYTVLCDRYSDSTIAYQGYGCGLEDKLDMIRKINHIATFGVVPDLTFYIDSDPKTAVGHTIQTEFDGRADSMESRGLLFRERVRRGFLIEAKKDSERIKTIPYLEGSPEKMQKLIREHVDVLLDGGD